MREILGLFVGLYLTVAIAVFGGAAYGFMSGEQAKYSSCVTDKNHWVPWALYRASLWPKTYFDDAGRAGDIPDWLLVHYSPHSVCT